MISRIASTALIATLAIACAPVGDPEAVNATTAESSARDCFYLSQVNGFNRAPDSADGNDQIYVSTGTNETYLFDTFGACPDLNYSETIAFDQNGPGTICSGLDVDLIVPSSIGPQRCPVRMIRKLSEAEEAAR